MAGRRGEAPVKARGTNTHTTKTEIVERDKAKTDKAAHRLAVVLRALELRADEPRLTLRQIYFRLKAETSNVAVCDPALLPWPSQPTFNGWIATADAIASAEGRRPSITDYLKYKTGGKQAKPMHPLVLDLLKELVLVQGTTSATRLWEDACEHAEQEKVPKPSRYQVRRFLESIPLEEIAAARHGSAAANADAMLKATIPTDYPHEVWTLDELVLPVWIRVRHPNNGKLVSVKPLVVLIVDNHSRVIVSYHIADPYRGKDDANGFTADDVLGALYSACIPQIAPEATRRYAGFLPDALRIDNAPQHKQVHTVTKKLGLHSPKLKKYAPWKRGMIERVIGTIKELCYDVRGNEDLVEPADQVTVDSGIARSRSVGTLERVKAVVPYPVNELLTIDQLREEFDKVIFRYNNTPHRRINRSTPNNRYEDRLKASAVRDGWAATTQMEVKVLKVRREGIEHRDVLFASEAMGRRLTIGSVVQFHCDPLKRALFTDINGTPSVLLPMNEWARTASPAQLDRENEERAKILSARGRDAREGKREREIGAVQAKAADDEAAERINGSSAGVAPEEAEVTAGTVDLEPTQEAAPETEDVPETPTRSRKRKKAEDEEAQMTGTFARALPARGVTRRLTQLRIVK